MKKEIENFIKKFRYMMIAIIEAGFFLTACGSRNEEEVQLIPQPESQSETWSETKPEPGSNNWAQAYLLLIAELQEDEPLDEIDFALIYVNDDDIPELVFGHEGYWVSVYTWQDGQIYTLMDREAYGLWGRVYAYVPLQGMIGTVCYSFGDTDGGHWYGDYWDFYRMTETYELEYAYGLSRIYDYVGDTYESETINYYYEEDEMTGPQEITEEEFSAYGITEREFYYEDAEKYILLIGHSSAYEIINELMHPEQAGRQRPHDEKETEITLSDITWDDYNSGSYDTWLHFSFSDGTVVDMELPYSPSIVEKADFIDITGDGADEVLIYRYFANTATEYTLINFFQIEENSVTEISPEAELEELAKDIWSVVEEDFSKQEYDMPILRLESYDKVPGLAYPDNRVLAGYQDDGWQILEWITCPAPDFE